jgi:hypothetical protein
MDVRRSDLPLLLHWIQARVLVILRTPRAAFFSLMFPLILLALLNGTNSGNSVTAAGGKVDFAQYFTPSIGIYALAVSCYTTPIFGLANARDQGILKRIRGTPLSPWIYLTSWLAGGIVTGLAAMTVMVIVSIPASIRSSCPRHWSQPCPAWALRVAHLLPLSHLVDAFTACFSPHTQGSGFAARDLAVIALWGLAGLAFAARRFRWESDSQEDVPHRPGGLRSILQRS